MPLRFTRAHIAFLHDLVMAALSLAISFYLRLGTEFLGHFDTSYLVGATAVFTAIAGAAFWSQKMYQGIWRYASLNDLAAITRGVTLTMLIFLPVMFFFTRLEDLPRSVLIINWFVLMALLGGPRFLYRLAKDHRIDVKMERDGRRRIPVLLVGAGDNAEAFIRVVHRDSTSDYKAVGVLGETVQRVGRNIHGVEVFDTIDNLEAVVAELNKRGLHPQRLILTREGPEGTLVRDLLERSEALGMTLARLPSLTDFKSGGTDRVEIKPIAVEDLLGRPQAVLDRAAMKALIAGRSVLITGAGGSIGSELVRQISDFGPRRLALLDSSEYALYTIDMELAQRHPGLQRLALIGDVRDKDRIDGVFTTVKPELVFHAAALKHVPMVEDNPFEGVLTNVIGTRTVADACKAHGVATMVLISTDKAVNPTNVMGATKRIAESYCQALDRLGGKTHYVTVRFGNVLGSTGSVVPLFQKQLARGGPLTVTHPEVTRFFMTIREAVELVLQASALGDNNETYRGKIFVLDMGKPVRIIDLAHQVIRLAGLRPDVDIKVEITGLRPGEKLYEEVLHDGESDMPTENAAIFAASPRITEHKAMEKITDALRKEAISGNRKAVFGELKKAVPEFSSDS